MMSSLNSGESLLSSIRSSCRELCKINSENDKINISDEAIQSLIDSMVKDNFVQFQKLSCNSNPLKIPLKFDTMQEELNFIGLNALLAFGSGWREELHEEIGRGAANTIKFGIMNMHISRMPYGTVTHMSSLSITDVSSIFQIPLLDEEKDHPDIKGLTISSQHCLRKFAMQIRDTLQTTAEELKKMNCKSLAQFLMNIVNSTKNEKNRAEKIVQSIVKAFSSFQDHKLLNGKDICIYKKAQLLTANLYRAYHIKNELFNFDDIENLTIFADNVIPVVLIKLGIIKPSSGILKQIEAKTDLSNTNIDLDLRAAAITSCEKLACKLRENNILVNEKSVLEIDLDSYFWSLGKIEEFKNIVRIVNKNTIFY